MANDLTQQKKRKFLEAHENGATVSEATRYAGVHRGTVYRWKQQDPEFAEAFAMAREKFVEDLEMAAYKRALEGNDRLLIFLLKAYKPDIYGGKGRQERSGSIGSTIAELAEKVRQWL